MSAIFYSFHPLFCDSDPFLTDKLIENYLGVVRVVKRFFKVSNLVLGYKINGTQDPKIIINWKNQVKLLKSEWYHGFTNLNLDR